MELVLDVGRGPSSKDAVESAIAALALPVGRGPSSKDAVELATIAFEVALPVGSGPSSNVAVELTEAVGRGPSSNVAVAFAGATISVALPGTQEQVATSGVVPKGHVPAIRHRTLVCKCQDVSRQPTSSKGHHRRVWSTEYAWINTVQLRVDYAFELCVSRCLLAVRCGRYNTQYVEGIPSMLTILNRKVDEDIRVGHAGRFGEINHCVGVILLITRICVCK